MDNMKTDLENSIKTREEVLEKYKRILEIVRHAEFFSTGSRFFGNHHPTSDFDFFIGEEEIKIYEPELLTIGFKNIRENYLNDVATIRELRFGNIDIQIVKQEFLTAKISARNKILKLLKLNPISTNDVLMSKRRAPQLWKELILISKEQE